MEREMLTRTKLMYNSVVKNVATNFIIKVKGALVVL